MYLSTKWAVDNVVSTKWIVNEVIVDKMNHSRYVNISVDTTVKKSV